MKILYGVQGTGNGHLSRARAMATAFKNHSDLEVSWLFSGRPEEELFEMGDFGSFFCRRGMTLCIRDGRVRLLKTGLSNNLLQLRRDRKSLDLSPYDLIISDYEPITSRALTDANSTQGNKPGFGIGHQYAFDHDIPLKGDNVVSRTIMSRFAPMPRGLGLHWYHFGQPILPPIIDVKHCPTTQVVENKVIVYLPFENTQQLQQLLSTFADFEFYLYAPGIVDADKGNVHTRVFSRAGFKIDLAEAGWVLCNSGFELISEALQLGKRIMSKPLRGQMEQLSNGAALQQLKIATVTEDIERESLDSWFSLAPNPVQIQYPDVAAAIAQWVNDQCRQSVESLSHELWQQTHGFETQSATTALPALNS